MTNPNYVAEDEAQVTYLAYAYPAYDAEDNAALFSHTGTLDTTGYGNGGERTIHRAGQPDVLVGSDTSARAISPVFDAAQVGVAVAPEYTTPIY